MPLSTPTTPTISGVTVVDATITKGADGNPGGTFYSFQMVYTLDISPIVAYLNPDGSFSSVPVWINTTALTAHNLVPNTLFSADLAAATDALGTGATSYGPAASFTTEASNPLFQQFSGIYSTTVTANWLANSNPEDTEYYVQLSTDPAFIFNVINSGWVSDTSFIFTDLLPNTIYYGHVKARNSILVETSYVTLGSCTTKAGPATVMGLRSTNLLANRGFIIQWSANPEPNIALYRVYRSSSPTDDSSFQVIATTPANVTSYVDNVPYSFGITWYYKVTALDTGNNESSLELTSPVQDMSFSQFVEQPFPTQVEVANIVNDEIPSGSIDGVNTLFTTTYPFKNNTLSIYLNGVKLMNGVDFTLNIPQQFTLVTPPLIGNFLRVSYLKF